MQQIVTAMMRNDKNIKFPELVRKILVDYYHVKGNESDLRFITQYVLQTTFCIPENKLKYYDIPFSEYLVKDKDYIIDADNHKMLTPAAFFQCLIFSDNKELQLHYSYIQEIATCYTIYNSNLSDSVVSDQCLIICRLYTIIDDITKNKK